MSTSKAPSSDLRNVISQGAIALAVCVGGYMFFVDPISTKVAALKSEQAALASESRAAESLRDLAPKITAAVAQYKAEADRIAHDGRLARQEQELYAAVTSAANACRVRIDQMSPNKVAPSVRPTAATNAAAEAAETGLNTSIGYTIDATATYTDLALFLKSIRTDLGFSAVKTVRLTPSSEPKGKLVHAFIETEHYSFDASPIGTKPEATASAGSH